MRSCLLSSNVAPSVAPLRPRCLRSLSRSLHARGTADLSGLGLHIDPSELKIKKLIGQGSFGEVFEGYYGGNNDENRVILKRVKSKISGAEQMGDNEHLLNVHVQKNATDSCASFLGYSLVDRGSSVVDRRLTPGKWLVWEWQGTRTLGEYMRRRDCMEALASDLGVPQEVAVPMVLKQTLESIQKLHAAGLVHRDVKPSNIIFCESDATFRLIDLGAMADLRTGINYCPDESILDPYYCPPEQYVLPTDAPDLARKSRVMSFAVGAMLWRRHKPDRFDMYSLGLIFMQLAMPHLRTKTALQAFHSSFKRCRYDLSRWRTISSLTAQHTAVLDADGGAGWELAEALLRPRKVQVLSDGHVYFTNEGLQRPSAEQALRYRFVAPALRTSAPGSGTASTRPAQAAVVAPTGGNGAVPERPRGLLGLFQHVQTRMQSLEDEVVHIAELAEVQTTTVRKLRRAVGDGDADEVELERAEGALASLTGSLSYLRAEMDATLRGADFAFRRGLVGTKIAHSGESMDRILESSRRAASPDGGTISGSESEGGSARSFGVDAGASAAAGLAGMLLGGIKAMGRAVRVTGHVVDRVNNEAQTVMERYRVKGELSQVESDYIALLEEAGVTASSRWADVQLQLAGEPRFLAVVGVQKLTLFRSYLRMLQSQDGMRLDAAERELMKQLAYRVTDPSGITWRTIRAAWAGEPFFRAVKPAAAETLFVRHVARLQQAQAARQKEAAAEMEFRAMLEGLQPPVTGTSEWDRVSATVVEAVRYSSVPQERRVAIFEELRKAIKALEDADASEKGEWSTRQGGTADTGAHAAVRGAEGSTSNGATPVQGRMDLDLNVVGATPRADPVSSADEVALLDALRQEQAKLKEEYDRMEAKLRAMETRLSGNGYPTDLEGGNGTDADHAAPRSLNGSSNGR